MPGGLVRGPYEDTQEEVRVAVEAETDPGSFSHGTLVATRSQEEAKQDSCFEPSEAS